MHNADTAGPPCDCNNCKSHGQAIWQFAYAGFITDVHEDGTVVVCRSATRHQRRRTAKFKPRWDGKLVPLSRGKRRERDLGDFGGFLNWVADNERSRPTRFAGVTRYDELGRPPGKLIDREEVRRLVDARVAAGYTRESSWVPVSQALFCSPEFVRKTYYS